MRESAGTVLYQRAPEGVRVLLVHPSGPYNRRAPWSIPKGAAEAGESLEAAARRETLEETGVVAGNLLPLGETVLVKSRKRIVAFYGPADDSVVARCASWEVDQAEFLPLARARLVIHPDQVPLLDLLESALRAVGDGG